MGKQMDGQTVVEKAHQEQELSWKAAPDLCLLIRTTHTSILKMESSSTLKMESLVNWSLSGQGSAWKTTL